MISQRAKDILFDWGRVRSRKLNLQHNINYVSHWKKSPFGVVKCNFDVALFANQRCFGIGLCLWDDLDRFIFAKTNIFLKVFCGLLK